MKYMAASMILFLATSSHAKQIILDIPDQDIRIVEGDVLDAEQWIRNAWVGKLNSCKERLIKREVERSVTDREPLPAGEDAIIQKALDRADFESRKEREQREADAESGRAFRTPPQPIVR